MTIMPRKIKTVKQWDAELKQESLHIRQAVELDDMKGSHEAKIPRVRKDLYNIQRFPDAKKREIYESLLEAGEITDEKVILSLDTMALINAEYQHEVDYYQNKLDKLNSVVELVDKEVELRDKKLVVRKV